MVSSLPSDLTPKPNAPSGVSKLPSGQLRAPRVLDNLDWCHSRAARHLRIMGEYLEPQARLLKENVGCTVCVFGSARSLDRNNWDKQMSEAKAALAVEGFQSEENRQRIEEKIGQLMRVEWMCAYYDKIRELCRRLSEWSVTASAHEAIRRILDNTPGMALAVPRPGDPSLAICTGGGPGMMRAANEGAAMCPGAKSMGFGITLPSEQAVNEFVNPELAFQFQYFFMRKFWMVYNAVAVISAPGGYGTIDELMEFLTMRSTGKIKQAIPVVMFGTLFWKSVINFEQMVELGLVHERHFSELLFTDDIDEAFNFITNALESKRLVVQHKSLESTKYQY